MGGGAPLAFLNKKTWHPGRFQNQEEVWKREQEAAAEQRKLDELRKQYEDERKASEFTQMAEEAGYKRDAKLDWMYAGSLAAKQDADARHDAAAAAAPATAGVPTAAALQQQQEQPLMAPRPAANEGLSRAEAAARLPSFLAADTPASQNEAWARLNNDPLLAIKKQEQDSLRRVRDNPVKMQQILREVEKVRSKHKKEKKEKKEKREKKDKKDKRGREHSSDGRLPLSGAAGVKRGRSRSRSASPHRAPRYAAPPAAAGAPWRGLHHGSRPAWAGDRPPSTAGGSAGGGSSRQQREPDRRGGDRRDRSRSRSRSRERAKRGDERREQSHGGRQQQADEPRQQQHQQHQQQRDAGDRHHHHSHQHHSSSGRIGGGGGGSYGLDLGSAGARAGVLGSAEAASAAAERAAATRQRLAEAAAAKEAAAAAAAAAKRHQRRDYKAGGLSAEERAARLAEMTGNAAQHEQQRLERLSKAHAADESDKGAGALLAKAAALRAEDAFKSAAAAEVFGSIAGGGMSLDARISSRRHYHER